MAPSVVTFFKYIWKYFYMENDTVFSYFKSCKSILRMMSILQYFILKNIIQVFPSTRTFYEFVNSTLSSLEKLNIQL